ncbi:hypothetical protein L1987_79343 [Smallanthus sonchifolius]|uniref:Uncharacterized protein n=1 Tax=Smallanthus sonchifolius TaxID=185202 RepID=A0ACB8ZG85_9ASTR|nr:hypothetical protein L1987_79343 [Smallanthus sonchifolius]
MTGLVLVREKLLSLSSPSLSSSMIIKTNVELHPQKSLTESTHIRIHIPLNLFTTFNRLVNPNNYDPSPLLES